MERYSGWRRRVAIAFYIISIITFLVSMERLVFDVFGQMWGTMLLNGLSTISLLAGLLAVCAAEKLAIALYAGWSVISFGFNLIIIFVYNDIGLLSKKEHYLGLLIGNDNWWRTHGIGCRLVTVGGDGSGAAAGAGTADQEMEAVVGSGAITTGAGGDGGGQGQWGEELVSCLLSYTVIEIIHAALFMFLTVMTFILSLLLLCSREKKRSIYRDDEEDFSYLSIGQWHENSESHRHDNRSRSRHSKILV